MNIDDVLNPYADEQPKVVMNSTKQNCIIERIPSIVDPATGQVTREFQEFFDNVVESVTTNDINKLYELSDKAVEFNVFESEFNEFHNKLVKILSKPKSEFGIDIELNLGRFEAKHRNLLGGLYVLTYYIEKVWTLSDYRVDLHKEKAELFFTYKDSKFMLLSCLGDFRCV